MNNFECLFVMISNKTKVNIAKIYCYKFQHEKVTKQSKILSFLKTEQKIRNILNPAIEKLNSLDFSGTIEDFDNYKQFTKFEAKFLNDLKKRIKRIKSIENPKNLNDIVLDKIDLDIDFLDEVINFKIKKIPKESFKPFFMYYTYKYIKNKKFKTVYIKIKDLKFKNRFKFLDIFEVNLGQGYIPVQCIEICQNQAPMIYLKYNKINLFTLFESRNTSIIQNKNIDYNSINKKDFSIKMFTGETGCGKTYNSIKYCVENNKSFVIIVPTRQLACDIKLDYKEINNIYTGEVSICNDKPNTVCVYENLNDEILKKHEVLIVDEAHYIGDYQRGAFLLDNVIKAINLDKEIIFLTATDTISKKTKEILNIQVEKLPTFKKIKKYLIDIDEVNDLVKKDKNVIVFVKYAPTYDTLLKYCNRFGIPVSKTNLMTTDTETSERLKTQIDFKNGKLQMIISTNVLAQGVNLPADIVVIEYNEYDDYEIVKQKAGRAGRPQFSDRAYIVHHNVPYKFCKPSISKKQEEIAIFYKSNFIYDLQIPTFQIPTHFTSYSGYKYSFNFLEKINKLGLCSKQEQKALKKLYKEQEKVKELF